MRRRPIVVPDRAGQLSEGLLVEASIVARLLSVRLLAIDARVVVVPARAPRRPRPVAIGGRLAAADRYLGEAASSLAASRLTPATSRAPEAVPAPRRP